VSIPSLDAPVDQSAPARAASARPAWTRPAAARALAAAGIVGVLAQQAARTNLIGVAGALLVLVAALALSLNVRLSRWGRICAALAAGLAPWLCVRASGWLVKPDVVAVAMLLVLAAGSRITAPASITEVAVLARHTASAVQDTPRHSLAAVNACRQGGRRRDMRAVARGAAVAVPLGVALLALLLTGDQFFASFLGSVPIGDRVIDALVVALGAFAWLVLVVLARRDDDAGAPTSPRRRIGSTEAGVVLAAVAAVFVVYVGALAVATIGGRAYVERTTGLTYAEYARGGFFQLVAAVAIVVTVLLALRGPISRSGRARTPLLALALVIVATTLVMVVAAVSRLQTYRHVFGLTMLRFSTTLFAVWLGVVVALIGIALTKVAWQPRLVAAFVLSAYATLAYANAVDPDVMVAHENIGRIDWTTGRALSDDGAAFDADYLGRHLSDDAVPALVNGLATLPEDQRAALTRLLCARPRRDDGWSWNLARERAKRALERIC
jgi:hypothetical protein